MELLIVSISAMLMGRMFGREFVKALKDNDRL